MYVPEEINSSAMSNILVGPIMCINFASKIHPKDKKEQNVYINVYLHQKSAEKFTEISIYGKKVRDSSLKYQFTPMRMCFRRDKLFRSFKKS